VRDLLRGKLFAPADYAQSQADLKLAKQIEANFKLEEAALKAKADAEKKAEADKKAAASAAQPTVPAPVPAKPAATANPPAEGGK